MSRCTCDACGEIFSGVTAFDLHQRPQYGQRPAVRCLAPAGLGLRLDEQGVWQPQSKRST